MNHRGQQVIRFVEGIAKEQKKSNSVEIRSTVVRRARTFNTTRNRHMRIFQHEHV